MRRALENIKVAFKSLTANKLRSFLTMLGIIIGVGAVVAVMAVGDGTEASINENLQSIGTNMITVSPGREQAGPEGMVRERFQNGEEEEVVEGDIYLEDSYAIEESGLFEYVVPVTIGKSSNISYQSWSGQVSISGVSEDYLLAMDYPLYEGIFLSEGDVNNQTNVAVLGSTVVDDFFGKIDPVGETIKIDGKNFIIVGTLGEIGTSIGLDPDNTIYVPVTTAQNSLFGQDTISSIVVKVEDEGMIDQAKEDIEDILRYEHKILPGDPNDFTIGDSTQLLEIATTISDTLSLTLASIAAISLLVGGIGIMNIMFVSVTERTKEIGVRKAIGAKSRDILVQFLTESIVVSLIGALLGLALAYLITRVLGNIFDMNVIITATPVILAISFSTLIGLAFGILPAMRAARLNPIESLRYE